MFFNSRVWADYEVDYKSLFWIVIVVEVVALLSFVGIFLPAFGSGHPTVCKKYQEVFGYRFVVCFGTAANLPND